MVATVGSAGGGRVVLEIDEGPQFHSGAIEVSGLSPELEDAVRRRVVCRNTDPGDSPAKTASPVAPPFFSFDHRCPQQAKQPENQGNRLPASGSQRPPGAAPPTRTASESSLWKAEKPARLDTVQLRRLRERVRLALADAGYPAAEFELAFAYHDQLADLKIQVTKLGAVAVVADIAVQGNHKDTDEEIIRFTGLRVGEPWTAQRREAVRVCLLDAARYMEHRVDEQITAEQVRLTIHVTEYPAAPPLSGEASPEEQVCFKYRDWLERGAGYQMDQILTATSEDFEGSLVLSPREGLIAEAAIGTTEAHRESTRCCLVLTSTELQLYLAQPRWKMRLKNTFGVLRYVSHLRVSLTEQGKIGRQYSFDAHMQSPEPGGPPASTGLTLSIAPLVYRALAHDNLVRVEWQGEELILWKTTGVVRLETTTGALREITGARDGNQYRVQVVSDAYRARRNQLEIATGDWREFPDPVADWVRAWSSSAPGCRDSWSSPVASWMRPSELTAAAGNRTWRWPADSPDSDCWIRLSSGGSRRGRTSGRASRFRPRTERRPEGWSGRRSPP